ncbi:MAG: hypothetical protein DME24_22045 [Verrucomicrobia bacterium]|nr:MAG: hypothetical protein DME24_22045 [Verrucomicrobiota bacterium]
MRQLIGILLILGAIWGCKELYRYWEEVKARKEAEDRGGRPPPTSEVATPTALPGLPANLEPSLQAAQKQGAAGLKNWLKLYRPYVSDPRLAAIELDYIVLISSSNPQEARQLFAAVKQRTPTNSPIFPRIRQLEKTYQ